MHSMKKYTAFVRRGVMLAAWMGTLGACRKTVEVPVSCPSLGTAVPQVRVNNLSNSIPNVSVEQAGTRASFIMTGVFDPVLKDFMDLQGSSQAGQNIWLEEDGQRRGVAVRQLEQTGRPLPVDIVFVIDNSGSMWQEADSIASQIVRFTNLLVSKNLDVKFGCIGQFGLINGALNLTDNASIAAYLNRPGIRGTARTIGFSGPDATTLQTKARNYQQNLASNENSIVGLFFANEHFNWRPDASRLYIIFTDAVTHTNGNAVFNNANFRRVWQAGQGTVHGVFSLDDTYWNGSVPDTARFMRTPPYTYGRPWDRPWELVQATGGTMQFIRSDCRDLSLVNLPVTQALSNLYLVEFCTAVATAQEHSLKITLRQPDGTSDGSRTLRLTYKPK
jgi:hypothetical protein